MSSKKNLSVAVIGPTGLTGSHVVVEVQFLSEAVY
jgi:ribosomal protein S28E/S33